MDNANQMQKVRAENPGMFRRASGEQAGGQVFFRKIRTRGFVLELFGLLSIVIVFLMVIFRP